MVVSVVEHHDARRCKQSVHTGVHDPASSGLAVSRGGVSSAAACCSPVCRRPSQCHFLAYFLNGGGGTCRKFRLPFKYPDPHAAPFTPTSVTSSSVAQRVVERRCVRYSTSFSTGVLKLLQCVHVLIPLQMHICEAVDGTGVGSVVTLPLVHRQRLSS